MRAKENPPRFLDHYLAGDVIASQIDEFIAAWHDRRLTGPDRYVELHVYLGMTWPEYRCWVRDRSLPSKMQHVGARWDASTMQVDGMPQMLRVHPPTRCRRPCPVHWPSEHPLVGAAKWWDPVEGVMMRICAHNKDHPDPDDQQVRLHPDLNEHDCDGCCTATVIEGSAVPARRAEIGGAT